MIHTHTLFSGKKTGDTKLINNNGKAEVAISSELTHTDCYYTRHRVIVQITEIVRADIQLLCIIIMLTLF